MKLWHLTTDAPRTPHDVRPGDPVTVWAGTWPIEPGQRVETTVAITLPDGGLVERTVEAGWRFNREANSYWSAELGTHPVGTLVRYQLRGSSPSGPVEGPGGEFLVRPRLCIALLWHQHQPLYRDLTNPTPRGTYRLPWVRFHALRDYYSKTALLLRHDRTHLTVNLTPVLLRQIQDYLEGATDR